MKSVYSPHDTKLRKTRGKINTAIITENFNLK